MFVLREGIPYRFGIEPSGAAQVLDRMYDKTYFGEEDKCGTHRTG
jgi:hypothetical protein